MINSINRIKIDSDLGLTEYTNRKKAVIKQPAEKNSLLNNQLRKFIIFLISFFS